MIRPIYRWKSFWFGVLVIAFLGWGWARSRQDLDGVFLNAGPFAIIASQNTGIVDLIWSSLFTHPGPKGLSWFHEGAITFGGPLFPKAVHWETHDGQIQLIVAHWFLILLFLLPWSGWLAWRWRRLRSISQTSAI